MKKKYYQRPDGLYETTRTLPNGKKKRFRGHTCKEVDDKILAYQEEQESGRPFETVAGEWWDLFEPGASIATANTYKIYYKRAVEEFGQLRIGTIKARDLQRFIGAQAKRGFAYYTINTQKIVLNQIFDYAVSESGDLERNVCRDVKMPKRLPKTVRPPMTAEQEAKVVAHKKGGDPELMAQMLLYTGMRIGELMALEWQDIDRKNGVIHVTKKINYSGNNHGVLEDHLKSENGKRDIPILEPLAEILPRNRIGLVFATDDGGHWPKHRQHATWLAFCESADLMDSGRPQITPHQLRHTFATICYEAGVKIKTCAEWMGDTEDVVSKIYQALRPQEVEAGVDRINEYFKKRALG